MWVARVKELTGILLVVLLLLTPLAGSAGDVRFVGSINRPADSDKSVEISGVVITHVINHTHQKIEYPFTIPAGNASTAYDISVPNPGSSVDDYIYLQVQCHTNCSDALVSDRAVYYSESHETVARNRQRFLELERFQVGPGGDTFLANLDLHPRYGVVRGRFKMPGNQRANNPIELWMFSLNPVSAYYTSWLVPHMQKVVIPEGASQKGFAFRMDSSLESFPTTNGGESPPLFGYLCISTSCREHNLKNLGWFDADFDNLFSNIGSVEYSVLQMTGLETFSFEIVQAIELLSAKTTVDVEVIRGRRNDAVITGRIVVEKSEQVLACRDHTSPTGERLADLDSLSGRFGCFDFLLRRRTIPVSSVPFEISADQNSDVVKISFETMKQSSVPSGTIRAFGGSDALEYQYIKVVCETGCSSALSSRTGYYAGEDVPSLRLNKAQSFKFKSTNDFYRFPIELNLKHDVSSIIAPIIYLLDDE